MEIVNTKSPPETGQRILIVYDSNGGNCYELAKLISRGVESVDECSAIIRSVAKVGERTSERLPAVPDQGAPYVIMEDLQHCHGLIIGGPTHFGNMSASLKYFFDQTTSQWFDGTLSGKPAAVFTSTGSMHGGQEATLLSMMIPLLHHGMLICGLPYSNPELMQTTRGGTPYGASHVSGEDASVAISAPEAALCKALGARVARIAGSLTPCDS
ncbi:MAG: NAD(P)H:quinone oxidoreductase [Granulosicoccus sp.]